MKSWALTCFILVFCIHIVVITCKIIPEQHFKVCFLSLWAKPQLLLCTGARFPPQPCMLYVNLFASSWRLLISHASEKIPAFSRLPAVLACIVEGSARFGCKAPSPSPGWQPATLLGSVHNGSWPALWLSGNLILIHWTVCVCHGRLASLLQLVRGTKSTAGCAGVFWGEHVNIWAFDP